MILNVTIKLTSPFLGSNKPNAEGIREIIKSENGDPILFVRRFYKLCRKYAVELGLGNYKYQHINIPNFIKTSNTEEIYQKSFKTKEGIIKNEKIKAYPVGSIMTLQVYINEKYIPIDKAIKIIEFIGQFDGISQYGIYRNYGRYEVLLAQAANE
jgi:hypothetical protein